MRWIRKPEVISDPDAYVREQYGEEFACGEDGYLPGFIRFMQYHLSLYYKRRRRKIDGKWLAGEGVWYSEGNCTLASVFAALNYLRQTGAHPRFPGPARTVTCRADRDRFYAHYARKQNYSVENPKNLPELYASIRDFAIHRQFYKTGLTNPFLIPTIIWAMNHKYRENVRSWIHVLWSFRLVRKEIGAGHPVILNVTGSRIYGFHSVVVTGYRVYVSSESGRMIHLLQIADNWSRQPRYLDLNALDGIRTIVTLK